MLAILSDSIGLHYVDLATIFFKSAWFWLILNHWKSKDRLDWQSLLQETLQLIDVFFLIRISWKDPELNRLVFTMWQLIISAVLAWSTVSFSQHWQHVIFSVWAIKLTSKCADQSANSLQVDIDNNLLIAKTC